MRQFLVVCAVGVLLAASGCGASGGTAAASPTSSSAATPAEELVITVKDGTKELHSWRLSCEPPAGTHPDPSAACQALAKNGGTALPAVPKDKVCSQRYGGSLTATIIGSWRGQPVRSQLSLVNGCEISRWKALEGLLPGAGA